VAEVLPVTGGIRRLVQQREPAERIKELAIKEGMRTLRESAMRAVRSGRTAVAEVLRVTQEDF
jgi:type II secretory ATPase GspE/PulE/Tfp pilus assembly ATPase PilB-like protein